MKNHDENLSQAFKRNARAVKLRPSMGRMTGRTNVRLSAGTRCEIDGDGWKLVCDLPESSGGTNQGPDPGPLGRGALGACLALGYRTQAAVAGIEIGAIEVEVEADFDAAGYYGVVDVAPGYLAVRCNVRVESNADEDVIRNMLDAADARSPWLDVFTRGIPVKRNVNINSIEQ
jgi:uncharacterized OsmC-like protein